MSPPVVLRTANLRFCSGCCEILSPVRDEQRRRSLARNRRASTTSSDVKAWSMVLPSEVCTSFPIVELAKHERKNCENSKAFLGLGHVTFRDE